MLLTHLSPEDYSEYIIYADESGNHGILSGDADYPVFVLVFCVFRKEEYSQRVVPAVQGFKFRHFGHDQVVLHEREIRKAEPPFSFLVDPERRERFQHDLTRVISSVPVTFVASVILKAKLRERYSAPRNLYHLALGSGLERIWGFLKAQGQQDLVTHVVCEHRGRREDAELLAEFDRVCQGANFFGEQLPFRLSIAHKRVNCTGLQLADLVARPIGRKFLSPSQVNRAYDVISDKLYQRDGRADGWGLRILP